MRTFLIIKVSRSVFHLSGAIMRNVPIILPIFRKYGLRNSTVGGRPPETLSAGIKRTAGSHPKERVSGGLPRTLSPACNIKSELLQINRIGGRGRSRTHRALLKRSNGFEGRAPHRERRSSVCKEKSVRCLFSAYRFSSLL